MALICGAVVFVASCGKKKGSCTECTVIADYEGGGGKQTSKEFPDKVCKETWTETKLKGADVVPNKEGKYTLVCE